MLDIILNKEYQNFLKASTDINFWTKNYITYKGNKISLNKMQAKVANSFEENKLAFAVKCRQTGGTLLGILTTLHSAIFNKNFTIGVISCNNEMSRHILKEIIDIYNTIEKKYKPNLIQVTKDIITFSNGSKIRIISGPSTIKGVTFNMIYVDEAAYNDRWKVIFSDIVPALPENYRLLSISSHNKHAISYNMLVKTMIDMNTKNVTFWPWYLTDTDLMSVKACRASLSFNAFVDEYECGGNYFNL